MTEESLETRLAQTAGVPFRYYPIDLAAGDEEFVAQYETLEDLEKWAGAIKKNPHDLGARRDLSGLLFGDSNFHMGRSPEAMSQLAKDSRSNGIEAMARYAESRFDYMFGELDAKSLADLLDSLPLYKTGKDKEHDLLVDLLSETKKMREMLKEKSLEKMRSYVMQSLKNESTPTWAKKAMSAIIQSDEGVVYNIFRKKYEAMNSVVNSALSDSEGNLDENKVRRLIRDSLDSAKDAYEDETEDNKKNDIWEDVIRPYYLGTAKAFYPIAQAEYTKSRPDRIIKMDERESERRKLGMAA